MNGDEEEIDDEAAEKVIFEMEKQIGGSGG